MSTMMFLLMLIPSVFFVATGIPVVMGAVPPSFHPTWPMICLIFSRSTSAYCSVMSAVVWPSAMRDTSIPKSFRSVVAAL